MTLLAGTLADLDLVTLADVTSLGRTSLRLEVSGADGAVVGHLVLKAGRIVSATAGALHGRNALHVILNAATNARFRLMREPLDFVMSAALASVDELPELARAYPRLARDSAPQPVPRTPSQPYAAVPSPPRRTASASEAPPIARRPGHVTGPISASLPQRPEVFARGTRVRMMEGRLDEFDLATLLSAIGLGRACVELEVVDDSGTPVGAVWVKSGKIVAARAGHIEGLSAMSQLLSARDGWKFTAFRVDAELGATDALADLSEVLGDAPAAARKAPTGSTSAVAPMPAAPTAAPRSASVPVRAPSAVAPVSAPRAAAAPTSAAHTAASLRTSIMEGSLDDFDVPTLLQTIATGRQYCELELLRDQDLIGRIRIKAGVVVSATLGATTGLPAMQRMVRLTAPHWFTLYRLSEAVPDQPPIGSLDKLLFAAVADTAGMPSVAGDDEDFDPPTVTDAPRRRSPTASRPVPAALSRETVRSLPDADELARSRAAAPSAALPAAQLAAVRPEPPRVQDDVPPTRPTVKSLPPVTRATAAQPPPDPVAALGNAELVPLMDGTLMDFDLRTLLEVLAVTRQHSRLVLLDAHDHAIGEIRMKAGFVLAVQAAGKEGAEALAIMLALPRVYRFRVLSDLQAVSSEWIGSIANLLAAATVRNSDTPERPTRFLWAAIPISFAIGGAIVFFLARTDRPRATPAPIPVVAPAASQPAAPTPAPRPAPATETTAPATETTAPAAPATETTAPAIEAAAPPVAPTTPAAEPREPAATATPTPHGEPEGDPPDRGAAPDREPVTVGMSVRSAQNALRRLGYDPGPSDNRYGKRTRTAILQFQLKHELPPTGYLDRETWSGIVAALTAQ